MSEKKRAAKSPSKGSKQKSKQAPAPKVKSSDARSSEAPAVSGERRNIDAYVGKIYTISSWKGMPNYECMFCGFATINHRSALEHAAEMHAPPEREIVDTGFVDTSGAPITRARQPKED